MGVKVLPTISQGSPIYGLLTTCEVSAVIFPSVLTFEYRYVDVTLICVYHEGAKATYSAEGTAEGLERRLFSLCYGACCLSKNLSFGS